jgi:signal transduction histidine kinase
MTVSTYRAMRPPDGRHKLDQMSEVLARWRVLPRARLVDIGLVLVLLVEAESEIWHPFVGHNRVGPPLLAVAATTVTCTALLWRRQRPLQVLMLIAAVTVGRALIGGGVTGLGMFAPVMVGTYSAARYRGDMPWYVAAAATALLAFGSTSVDGLLDPTRGTSAGFVAFAYVVLVTLWVLGTLVRSREHVALQLAERADALEGERDRKAGEAVAEERARIARELHDVVAHSVSVLIVQAQAAETVLEREPEKARSYLRKIDATARDALAEMRRLVDILDTDRSDQLTDPQPGLARLAELADHVRGSGLRVCLEVRGTPLQLSPGVDLAAFRIVQEALTNALRHARATEARVTLIYSRASLEVEVIDDGLGRATQQHVGGRGLIGMEERVSLYGGKLTYGPNPDRGFAVRAEIPIDGVLS